MTSRAPLPPFPTSSVGRFDPAFDYCCFEFLVSLVIASSFYVGQYAGIKPRKADLNEAWLYGIGRCSQAQHFRRPATSHG